MQHNQKQPQMRPQYTDRRDVRDGLYLTRSGPEPIPPLPLTHSYQNQTLHRPHSFDVTSPTSAHFQRCTQLTRSIAHYYRIAQIGEGTYGQVYKARDLHNGRTVALKKIRLSNVDKTSEGMPRTVIREIKILRALRHKNMVEMIEVVSSKGYEDLDQEDERIDDKRRRLKEESSVVVPGSKSDPHSVNKKNKRSMSKKTPTKKEDLFIDLQREKFKGNLFLVLEYISHDLSGILDMGFRFSAIQSKCIFRQLLSVLDYMHENRYIHRDLKSSNLLIDSNYRVKLADFGLARSMDNTFYTGCELPEYTNKVVTLWYRPPELLFGATHYDEKVDIWSAGCILGELLFGKTLFPGKSETEQLRLIFEIMGTPSKTDGLEDHIKIRTKEVEIREELPSTFKEKYASFETGPNEKAALSLMERLLALNPKKRLRAGMALQSQYFKYDPIAPDNPEKLGVLDVGGDSHEFETKPIRKEAKVHAQKAAEEAKGLGLDEKQAYEHAYDKFLKAAAKERAAGHWGGKEKGDGDIGAMDNHIAESASGISDYQDQSNTSKRHKSSKDKKSRNDCVLENNDEEGQKSRRRRLRDENISFDADGDIKKHSIDRDDTKENKDREKKQENERNNTKMLHHEESTPSQYESRERGDDGYHLNGVKDRQRGHKGRDKREKATKRSKKHKESRYNDGTKERKRRRHESTKHHKDTDVEETAPGLNKPSNERRYDNTQKHDEKMSLTKSESRDKDKKKDRNSSKSKSSHDRKSYRHRDEHEIGTSRRSRSKRSSRDGEKHGGRKNRNDHKERDSRRNKRSFSGPDRDLSTISQREWEHEAEIQLRNEKIDSRFTEKSHNSNYNKEERTQISQHQWQNNRKSFEENQHNSSSDFHLHQDNRFSNYGHNYSPSQRCYEDKKKHKQDNRMRSSERYGGS